MSERRSLRLLSFRFLVALPLTAASLNASETGAAVGVSPGEVDGPAEVATACPTFSWGALPGADRFELVVLDLEGEGGQRVAFRREVAGSATSWTPGRVHCLRPGGRFAWSVRGLDAGGEPIGGERGWAPMRRFSVPGAPSAIELAAALEIVRRYDEMQRGRSAGPEELAAPAEPSPRRAAPAPPGTSSGLPAAAAPAIESLTGTSAIRGENAGTSGNQIGVTGRTASAAGAGVVAINLAGGPDLVLDGEADADADALVSQSGIDRPSASGQTFDIRNSGSGAMTLRVDGVDVLTTATGGDITSVGAGSGLSGGGSAGAVSLQVAALGISSSMLATDAVLSSKILDLAVTTQDLKDDSVTAAKIAANAVGAAEIADGAVGAAEVNGAEVQVRVAGSCPDGLAIGGINADGSVVCADLPLPPRVSTFKPFSNDWGSWSSIAIGTDGSPVVAFYDASAGNLVVVGCGDPACADGSEIATTADNSANDVGEYASIAIGLNGTPVISYHDATAGALLVMKCNDASCSAAGGAETISTVDNPANTVGQYTSIAIGTDGFPVISYYDATASALKVAKCNDTACAGGNETITTVDNAATVGWYSSIAIGNDSFPVISYQDIDADSLKVVKCNDVACAGGNETITTVHDAGGPLGQWTSIAIRVSGLPIISYYDTSLGVLRVAQCNDVACAGANETLTIIDNPQAFVGQYSSIAIGADGLPVIAYYDGSHRALKLLKCNDSSCAGVNESITTLDDGENDVGRYASVAVGLDGFPVVSYYDQTSGALKIAKCWTASCRY